MVSNITASDGKYAAGKFEDVFGFPSYCADDIMFRPKGEEIITGRLCCCNIDWCNVNHPNESMSDYEKIKLLDSGTMEDYRTLQEIAEKYDIY
ncbi:unnamed protein product [Thelazia callipaeda]|uniref:CN hydrolase domain-containing protein n=1 Tax=Thelazia callipaeda TaxID=103827 RepID=A0A0N5D248_THECL|nr:unnamed protein product [Thelazia callipaeda]